MPSSIKDVDAVFYGIYNDIFDGPASRHRAGFVGMQNKFGMRVARCATGAYNLGGARIPGAGRFKTALVWVEEGYGCFDFLSCRYTGGY
jgi:hypothetical protein